MDAHFKQISDILKEEECQGQLVTNSNEYYMEDECTYYHEQAITLRSEEVVENQVDERKEEQIEVLGEPHQEKEESTKTFSTSDEDADGANLGNSTGLDSCDFLRHGSCLANDHLGRWRNYS
jgi:hypothetical protein